MRKKFWILPALVVLTSVWLSTSEPAAQTGGGTAAPASSSDETHSSQSANTTPSPQPGVYDPNAGGNVGDGEGAARVDVSTYQCSTSDAARCECERAAIVSGTTIEQAQASCAR